MIITIFTIVILTVTLTPVSGQNPSYLDWRKYESDHFIVYYPEGQEMTAWYSMEVAEQMHPAPSRNVRSP